MLFLSIMDLVMAKERNDHQLDTREIRSIERIRPATRVEIKHCL